MNKELNNQIHQADVLDFLAEFPDQSIDLAIADPPYNSINAEWDKFPSQTEFYQFTEKWIEAVIPKLKANASLYLFNTPYNCAYILNHLEGKRLRVNFRNWITWYKKDGLSVAKKGFCNNQETILFFTKGKNYTFNFDEVRIPYTAPKRVNSPKGILKNGKRWFPNPLGKLCPDVWEISSDRHKKKVRGRIIKNEHPTPKPEDLMERMIKASSNQGDLVLDLFSGTGTTSVVAQRLGRNFIGVEKEEKFCQIAIDRLAQVNNQSLETRIPASEAQPESLTKPKISELLLQKETGRKF
jgi:site-specific DNA-methyltransferase (adenine-specific)